MALADALAAGPPHVKKGPRCYLGLTLNALPPSEREALEVMLADERWTSSSIFEALKREYDARVPAQGIARHRRKECTCDLG